MLRVYPPRARLDRGDEMLGTLLDAADSPAAFVRESASLVLAGIRERARVSAQISGARLLADAFRQATLVWIVIWLAGTAALVLAHPKSLGGLEMWLMLLWPIAAVSMLGYDRLAGACGAAWMIGVQLPIASGPYPFLLAGSLVPLIGFSVMIITPRRRPRNVRRLAWLVPIIAVSVITQPVVLGFGALGILSLTGLSTAGALLLVADPRLLMATALVWASIGMMYTEPVVLHGTPISSVVLLVAGAPVTILIVSARLRKLRLRSN